MEKLIKQVKEKTRIDELTELVNDIKAARFNKKEYLLEKIHQWHQAIDQNQPKVHLFTSQKEYDDTRKKFVHKRRKNKYGKIIEKIKPEFFRKYHWNQTDTLEEWLMASLEEIQLNQNQIKEKKKNYTSLTLTNIQQQFESFFANKSGGKADKFTYDPMEVQKYSQEWYDYLEWDLAHQLECIKEVLKDPSKIPFQLDSIVKDETKIEIGKMLMESFNKKNELVTENIKFKNKIQKANG